MKYIRRDTVKETKRFDKMVKFYQSNLTLPRLMISQHIGIAVEGFLTMFQCKGPLIHIDVSFSNKSISDITESIY